MKLGIHSRFVAFSSWIWIGMGAFSCVGEKREVVADSSKESRIERDRRNAERYCMRYQDSTIGMVEEYYVFPRVVEKDVKSKLMVGILNDKIWNEESEEKRGRFYAELLGERVELIRLTENDYKSDPGKYFRTQMLLGSLDIMPSGAGWQDVVFFRNNIRIGTKKILIIEGQGKKSQWEARVQCQIGSGRYVQLDHVLIYVDGTPIELFDKIVEATGGRLVGIVPVGFGNEPFGNCDSPFCFTPIEGIALKIVLPATGFKATCGALNAVDRMKIPGVRPIMPTALFSTTFNVYMGEIEWPKGDCMQ
jgi:hypothetical protein